MEKILLKVDGMDCANCAQTITRTLTKEGLKAVNVDFLSGEVTFEEVGAESVTQAVNSIHKLGYTVKARSDSKTAAPEHEGRSHAEGSAIKFFVALVFTVPLIFHMVLPFGFLHKPLVQLLLSLPVMYIGVSHFGKSAYYSIRAGSLNMDVLIFIGSAAAFIYSVSGMIMYEGKPEIENYLFFETSASIITLVLLGGLIEQRSVKQTTSSISHLGMLQPRIARKVVIADGRAEFIETDSNDIQAGDLVSVSSGDRVAADGVITKGNVVVDESMLTGESIPVSKSTGDTITGGTYIQQGNAVFSVQSSGNDTALAHIIEIVKQAQHSKPQIQRLGDKISSIFVPVVLGISALTFLVSYFVISLPLPASVMHSIAVLVISCPCAMGLATPTAVMVGLGRAARNGILIKGGETIEKLAVVKTIVFDKTGTLTTGNFRIKKIETFGTDEERLRSLLFSIEQHSSHPLAKAITKELSAYKKADLRWKNISEDKGIGMNATDTNGDLYSIGSFKMVQHFYKDLTHDLYILKNNALIGIVDLEDEIKNGAPEVISWLKANGFRVVLLSGDRKNKCAYVAEKTGIEEYYYEKLPAEKLQVLDELSKEHSLAMVGDGINDAPSLTKADVGISLSNASDIAIQSAQVILLSQNDFEIFIKSLQLGKMTYRTIKQNLFWAFFYNVIAIPVAAAGLLSPGIAALSMAFSDVIVIGNSLRLRTKKL